MQLIANCFIVHVTGYQREIMKPFIFPSSGVAPSYGDNNLLHEAQNIKEVKIISRITNFT